MKNLQHKKIIITGAGSGMGREMAYKLAAEGTEVYLTDINGTSLQETLEQVIASGGKGKAYVVDSGNEQQIYEFSKQYLEEEEFVDVLINNAGMALGEIKLMDVKEEHLKKIVDVNMWGVIHFTRAFLPNLLTRPEAHLVNTSSVFGIIGVETQVPYCTTKFAVRGFTEALRMELAETNVTVSCVHPGGIKTNIVRNGVHYVDAKKTIKQFDTMARTTAAEAAAIIIKGIKNGRERILIGPDAWLIDRIARLFPVSYTRFFRRIHHRYLKK